MFVFLKQTDIVYTTTDPLVEFAPGLDYGYLENVSRTAFPTVVDDGLGVARRALILVFSLSVSVLAVNHI